MKRRASGAITPIIRNTRLHMNIMQLLRVITTDYNYYALGDGTCGHGAKNPRSGSNSKAVNTPGVAHGCISEVELPEDQARRYRALVARANYLAQDRADIGFPVKELCRRMAKPRECDWEALKRLGRLFLAVRGSKGGWFWGTG